MATLPKAGAVTLLDFAKSIDPDGKTATVVELLNQTNEILTDMMWLEGNQPTGHRSTIRTGLPTSVWRQLYQGVPASKSTRAQVDDTCGMLETRAEVDKDIAELNGNTSEFRLSEAQAFLESMNQTMASSLFYGDQSINPERITGLAPRFSLKSAPNGGNIIDAGGTGADNTSIWLVVWGKNTAHGIFPKGSKAGLIHEDMGLIDAFDSNNNRFRAYADHWQWKSGLTLRDWRYVVRIANVKISDLVNQTGTQAPTAATAIMKLMLRAMARIPAMGMGTPVFYANRTVKEMLSIAALDKSQNALAIEAATNQFGTVAPGSVGNGTLRFFGTPVRTVDQILSTEAQVV
ncbi:major capsid protein [Achromobacter insuavis]|uniref:Phage protein n=1 Tax=Achromobacter insuavis AXX-A TaxID=1003200 RepID=F7T9F2_9BURK|nr:hypothetical protein [Achromobacter insuavis]EGP43112.1 hypothetical protein AXXA_27990 [Achromobacter insuavis AXX-A]